jgi:hypothetical protein
MVKLARCPVCPKPREQDDHSATTELVRENHTLGSRRSGGARVASSSGVRLATRSVEPEGEPIKRITSSFLTGSADQTDVGGIFIMRQEIYSRKEPARVPGRSKGCIPTDPSLAVVDGDIHILASPTWPHKRAMHCGATSERCLLRAEDSTRMHPGEYAFWGVCGVSEM